MNTSDNFMTPIRLASRWYESEYDWQLRWKANRLIRQYSAEEKLEWRVFHEVHQTTSRRFVPMYRELRGYIRDKLQRMGKDSLD